MATPEELRREAEAKAAADRKAQDSAKKRAEAQRRSEQNMRVTQDRNRANREQAERDAADRAKQRAAIEDEISRFTRAADQVADELRDLYEKQAKGDNSAGLRRAIASREKALNDYNKRVADAEAQRESLDRTVQTDNRQAAAVEDTAAGPTAAPADPARNVTAAQRGQTPSQIAAGLGSFKADVKRDGDAPPVPRGTVRTAADRAADAAAKKQAALTEQERLVWVNYLDQTFKSADITEADRKEILDIVARGRKEGWSADKIAEFIDKRTKWGQRELPRIKSFVLLSADPTRKGEFEQTKANRRDYLVSLFAKQGIAVADAEIDRYALDSLKNDLTDAQIAAKVAADIRLGKIKNDPTGGGVIAQTRSNLVKFANSMGINLSDEYVQRMTADILDPLDQRDETYYENLFRMQAAELYAPYADQIKQGQSLYDLTYGYRSKMAALLEVGENDIDWNDLMSKVVTRDNQKVSAWDFEKQIKQDPRWAYTKNARSSLDAVGRQVLRDFGLVG